MSEKKPNDTSRFVITYSESEWDSELQRYATVYKEGYWYDGPWALAMDVDAVYVAEDYQWINDNGSITTATQVANENTAVTTGFSPGDNIRLRVNFGETAAAQGTGLDTGGWTLQFAVDGGSFATVGAATDVKYFNSSNLTNGTVIITGNHILNWSGSEVPQAWGDENEDGVTPSETWSNDVAEAEFSIQFDAGLSDTAVLTFRLLGPDAAVVTFTNVPTITLEAPPAAGEDPLHFERGATRGVVRGAARGVT